MINFEDIDDFANDADQEISKFRIQDVVLSAERLKSQDFEISGLNWEKIHYLDEGSFSKIPSDKRGIYAFAISVENEFFPNNSLILYIGIAGRKSDRSLRERFSDYHSRSKILKRPKISRMLSRWREVLVFYYAPIETAISSSSLELFEKQLSTLFLPPMGSGDVEANLKKKRSAF